MVAPKNWLYVLAVLLQISFSAKAQQCSNCKQTPSIAQYDLDVQVPKPELKGEKTEGWLEWLQLFWLSKHAQSYLYQNNKNCVRFLQPPSQDDGKNEILKVGETPVNLAASGKDLSSYGNYILTGFVAKSGSGYLMHIELQAACSRKVVASSEVNFQLSAESSNTVSVALQAASRLSPLIDKIKQFELEERKQNPKFVLAASDPELIQIKPAKTKLVAGQETEITLTLKDCDGEPLAGKEIFFRAATINGVKIPGTIGGKVEPAKVITNAQGIAKAKFIMTAPAGNPAIINAHTLVQNFQSCQSALIGSVQIDALPGYKVMVDYTKTGSEDIAGVHSNWEVSYAYSLIYYSSKYKSGEQIVIMPEFEATPETPKKGKTEMIFNRGYSDFTITEYNSTQRAFSNTPLLPSVFFLFNNNDELVFFSSDLNFPEKEDELSPVTGSFGVEKDNKKFFPVKAVKVDDPQSPYKWYYEFTYKDESGYSLTREAIPGKKQEIETATIKIFKTF